MATPVFLPGKFHGQRSLAGHPWGHKESDTTERITHTHKHQTKAWVGKKKSVGRERGNKESSSALYRILWANKHRMIDFRNHYFPNPDVIINSKVINEC